MLYGVINNQTEGNIYVTGHTIKSCEQVTWVDIKTLQHGVNHHNRFQTHM